MKTLRYALTAFLLAMALNGTVYPAEMNDNAAGNPDASQDDQPMDPPEPVTVTQPLEPPLDDAEQATDGARDDAGREAQKHPAGPTETMQRARQSR